MYVFTWLNERGVSNQYRKDLLGHKSKFAGRRQIADLIWWVLTGSNRRHSPCKGVKVADTVAVARFDNRKLLIVKVSKNWVVRPLQRTSPGEHRKA